MAQSEQGAAFVAGGAATGAWVSVSVGGMGLAFSGTAISLGVTPLTAVGAVTGAAGYGVLQAIVEGDASALGAATLGGLGGAGVSVTIGGMGLALKGTAISLGMAPITVAGAVVGLAIYGLLKMVDTPGSREAAEQVFRRMEDKIFWQEAYTEALLELDPTLAEWAWNHKLAALDVEEDVQMLKAQLWGDLAQTDAIRTKLQALTAQALPQQPLELNFIDLCDVTVQFASAPETDSSNAAEDASHHLQDATPAIAPEPEPAPETESRSLTAQPFQAWKRVRILKPSWGTVTSLAISPDSQNLASGSSDGTVTLWNLKTGKSLFTFLGQAKEASTVVFSPDRQALVSGSLDQKITAWNLANKNFLRTFLYLNYPYSHAGFVNSVVFSPEGEAIVSGGGDRIIRLWNWQTGKPIRTLNGHSESVLSVAMSADGQILVSGSADQTIQIWHLSKSKPVHTLRGHTGWIFSVAIAPDGQTLVSASGDSTIKLWHLHTGELLNTLTGHSAGVFSVAISPDGQTVASGSRDGTVKLWNLSTGELLQTLDGGYPVAFSPDGKTLVSGGRVIQIWHQAADGDRGILKTLLTREWWEILGVEADASLDEVKQAYRTLARQYHPDINTSASATTNMQTINHAYKTFRRQARKAQR